MYINRYIENELKRSLRANPVTAIIGSRQCGKSTLVKEYIKLKKNALYFDLEKLSDLEKFKDAEYFLTTLKGKLICIDEIQRLPELFPLLRSICDEWGGNGRFVVLGSASRDLLRQSSETLAGRIEYIYLTPFLFTEINDKITLNNYLIKGGFPKSVFAKNSLDSIKWRESFIRTFLERDLLMWSGFSPATMRKLWQMLAFNNGQTVNYSQLGNSLSVSDNTVRNYIELLEGTFMVQVVQPYFSNLGKRLIKSPKVYISDAGITNALLNIHSFDQLIGNPVFGFVWESIILQHIKSYSDFIDIFFYRTSNGSEIDFIIKKGSETIAIECKASLSPNLEKGTYAAIEDIHPIHTIVVCPIEKGWPMKKNITVANISEMLILIKKILK